MKKDVSLDRALQLVYPKMPSLVAVGHGGKKNVVAIAWHTGLCYNPPHICISVGEAKASHKLLKAASDFTLNFVSHDKLEAMHYCGRHSGDEVDKFEATGLTPAKSKAISSPYIKESYAHLECKVVNIVRVGDHDLFIAEVVAAQADEDAFDGTWIKEGVQPILSLGENLYTSIGGKRTKLYARKKGDPLRPSLASVKGLSEFK